MRCLPHAVACSPGGWQGVWRAAAHLKGTLAAQGHPGAAAARAGALPRNFSGKLAPRLRAGISGVFDTVRSLWAGITASQRAKTRPRAMIRGAGVRLTASCSGSDIRTASELPTSEGVSSEVRKSEVSGSRQ